MNGIYGQIDSLEPFIFQKPKSMKRNPFFVFVLVLLFFACGNDEANRTAEMEDPTTTTTGTEVANDMGWDQARVSDFINKAAAGGMMEVQLGQLAAEKATTPEVKNFGQMMVTEHSKANEQLKSVAQSMQVNLPASLPEDKMQKVNEMKGLTGEEFTKRYVNEMVADHQADISLLEDARPNVTNPQLKSWIESTLPVMQQHLQEIQRIQSAQNNM